VQDDQLATAEVSNPDLDGRSAPTPAENATGYHLLSPEDATKHRPTASLPGMGHARAWRIADTATNFGIIRIKKVPAQPFAATVVFYIFDQDAAGLLDRYEMRGFSRRDRRRAVRALTLVPLSLTGRM
jgi:hypothetical protein